MSESSGKVRYSRMLVVFASFAMVVSAVQQLPVAAAPDSAGPSGHLMVAAKVAPGTVTTTPLTDASISAALTQAISSWLAVAPSADLSAVTATSSNLSDLQLASTSGTTITVDDDAGGWGWSVSFPGESGHMDLPTVLRHELGHVLGLDHASGLMSATLSADETRGVSASDAAGLEPPAPEPVAVDVDVVAEAVSEPVDADPVAESVDADPVGESVDVNHPGFIGDLVLCVFLVF